MKKYRLSFADSCSHKPEHPERTAKRASGWDTEYQVWNSAGAMAKSLEMQASRAGNSRDWIPCDKNAMELAVLASRAAKMAAA